MLEMMAAGTARVLEQGHDLYSAAGCPVMSSVPGRRANLRNTEGMLPIAKPDIEGRPGSVLATRSQLYPLRGRG